MKIDSSFIEKLRKAKSLLFFTGAGISAESGIPTFRGKDGIWNKLKPEELANFNAFLKNPDLVWEWYQHRRKIVHESQPNKGHLAIAGAEKYFDEVTVVTQNIDNLHKRAGSSRVYELHGNIERNYCIECKKMYSGNFEFTGKVPLCECGGLIRPEVVWFGEYLPEDQFAASEDASKKCDIFFIVGTSGIVYPAASLIMVAARSGALLVEINTEYTEVSSHVDYSFFGPAGEVLPAVLNAVK